MGERAAGWTVREALLDVEVRLARIEAHLGLTEPQEERAKPVVDEPPPPAIPRYEPPPLPAASPAPLPVIPAYQPLLPVEPAPQGALEQTIGLKWAGWVGAVVVVIGAGLGIKYAYDQGWFQILPPAGRLLLMSLGAFALIGAGEVVFRRIHRFAAACLYGAGVATLFLVSYAGHGYYGLYEAHTAYVLMAFTTIIGASVAIRGDLLSIAVLAQIGGNLAPVLLHSDRPLLAPFLTYLLTLQVVAIVLAWWGGGGRWWTLRVMSLATLALWIANVISVRPADGTVSVLVFSLLYAALFQAELILSAARPRRPGAPAQPAETLSLSMSLNSPAALAVTFSVAVTAVLTTAILFNLNAATDGARGAWVLVLAAACAALGFGVGRGPDPGTPLHNLSLGYRVQAAALVVVAVPVALSGVWIIAGWAALSLAFAAAGNLLDLRLSRWTGVMVWRLALLYLGWWTVAPLGRLVPGDTLTTGAHAVWLHLLGVDIRAYTILAWLLAAVGHTVSWLIHQEGLRPAASDDRRFQRLAWVTSGLAGFAWLTASCAGLPPVGATLAILVYAWLLLGVDLLNPRLGLALQSAVVVALVAVKWVAVDTLAERLAPHWSATDRRPVLNAVMGSGLLISATMALLYWLRRDVLGGALGHFESRRGACVSPAAPVLTLAALLMTLFAIGLTYEIDRAIEAFAPGAPPWSLWQLKHLSWTVLWMLCLTTYVALSRLLEPDAALRPGVVRVAQRLAVAVAVKFLLLDTLWARVVEGATPSHLLLNAQTLTAAVVVAAMVFLAWLAGDPPRRRAGGAAGFLAVLVVLWCGTLEIDRFFERLAAFGTTVFADPVLAKQVAFSIFWSTFAIGAVVAGFRFRTAGLRYFGLGLFAVTLLKVVLVDMSQVQTGYRVLSFLGLGLLLLGTSVLYGKLSPVLLRPRDALTTS
jgi:uncharacterized membrane protein